MAHVEPDTDRPFEPRRTELQGPRSGLPSEFARMSKGAIYIELGELNVATPIRGDLDSRTMRMFSQPWLITIHLGQGRLPRMTAHLFEQLLTQ